MVFQIGFVRDLLDNWIIITLNFNFSCIFMAVYIAFVTSERFPAVTRSKVWVPLPLRGIEEEPDSLLWLNDPWRAMTRVTRRDDMASWRENVATCGASALLCKGITECHVVLSRGVYGSQCRIIVGRCNTQKNA